MSDSLQLSIEEAGQAPLVVYNFAHEIERELTRIWFLQPTSGQRERAVEVSESRDHDLHLRNEEARRTFWSVAFAPTFRKSVASVDKKLQGRVLLAIAELSEEPLTVLGDTVKPLVGAWKGLWRYRLGDYRLVYEPRQVQRLVVLLEFASRGGVYES